MKNISITEAIQNLDKLITDVNIEFNAITIVNCKGKNAVLISEEKWKNIKEILYLHSIPGYINNLNEIRKNEIWKDAKEYNAIERW